jgi:hypothetical protein
MKTTFDNSKPNIVLMTDYTHPLYIQRTLGVTKIADLLKRNGFEVLVVNHLHVFGIEEILELLGVAVSDKTLYIGINSVFYQSISQPQNLQDADKSWELGGIKYTAKEPGSFLPHGKKFNTTLKETVYAIAPNCKFVLGGPDAADVDANSDYDYLIQGLADLSAVNLARHLAFGDELKNSRRSLYKFTVVTDITAAGYDFVGTQMTYGDHDIVIPGESLPIEIARGCIFNCKFCSYPLNGKKKNDYVKHEDVLYAEFIDNYEKYGTTRYLFADDTFNDSKEKLQAMYRISKKLPFKLEYWTFARLDLLAANKETIDLLFGSGCVASFFGIETLHRAAAAFIGKGGSREKLISAIKTIKNRYGDSVSLAGGFIFGLPREDIDSIKRTGDQLINGETGLDSWFVQPLQLRSAGAAVYNSDIDINYEKYGYEIIGFDEETQSADWKNPYTTFAECKKLGAWVHNESINGERMTIRGLDTFYMSTLGIDLKDSLNQKVKHFNWHNISIKKSNKVLEYKQALSKYLNTALSSTG